MKTWLVIVFYFSACFSDQSWADDYYWDPAGIAESEEFGYDLTNPNHWKIGSMIGQQANQAWGPNDILYFDSNLNSGFLNDGGVHWVGAININAAYTGHIHLNGTFPGKTTLILSPYETSDWLAGNVHVDQGSDIILEAGHYLLPGGTQVHGEFLFGAPRFELRPDAAIYFLDTSQDTSFEANIWLDTDAQVLFDTDNKKVDLDGGRIELEGENAKVEIVMDHNPGADTVLLEAFRIDFTNSGQTGRQIILQNSTTKRAILDTSIRSNEFGEMAKPTVEHLEGDFKINGLYLRSAVFRIGQDARTAEFWTTGTFQFFHSELLADFDDSPVNGGYTFKNAVKARFWGNAIINRPMLVVFSSGANQERKISFTGDVLFDGLFQLEMSANFTNFVTTKRDQLAIAGNLTFGPAATTTIVLNYYGQENATTGDVEFISVGTLTGDWVTKVNGNIPVGPLDDTHTSKWANGVFSTKIK